MTPAGRQIIVVGGHSRTGGELTCRLLDGHPAIASFPTEPNFFIWSDFFAPDGTPRRFRNAGTLGELAVRVGLRKKLTSLIHTERLAAGHYDADVFERMMARPVPDDLGPSDAVELLSEAMFAAWTAFETDWREVAAIAFHKHDVHTAPLHRLLPDAPAVRVLHTLRLPHDRIHSKLKYLTRKRGGEPPYLDLESEALGWCASALQAAHHSAVWPDRYRVIRYEDTATAPTGFAETVSDFLGVANDPILTEPTLAGRPWGGNSGFGEKTGVQASIGHHIDYLGPDDRALISRTCAPWLDRFGYLDEPPFIRPLATPPKVDGGDLAWLAARQNLAYEMISRGNELTAVRWARRLDGAARRILRRPLP